MAPPDSRFERYKILMRGEENMPKQYIPFTATEPESRNVSINAPNPTPAISSVKADDQENSLRGRLTATNDEYLRPHSPSSDWAAPKVSYAGLDTQERERLARESEAASMKHPSSSKDMPTEPLPESFKTDGQFGEVSPFGVRFCPILALAKFPYKYLPRSAWSSQQAIASKFFDEGKFWQREWSLYYVSSNEADTDKVVIFITESQAKSFINEIDRLFPRLNVRVPDVEDHPGFICEFPKDPLLRPHWLGRSRSRQKYDFLENEAPVFDMLASRDPSDRNLQAFKDMIDNAIEAAKNKRKNANNDKKRERIVKQQNMLRQLKRAQRYLGLRPRNEHDSDLVPGVELNGSKYVRHPIDVAEAAPYPPDMDVIFISIDIELYERNHNLVTEIGVATLDTRDIGQIPPDAKASEWFKLIRGRHFRIKEYTHLNNTDFVHGCADKFEFGKSEFISIVDAPQTVASCFKEPFSKPQVGSKDKLEATYNFERNVEKRNIVFVGHNPGADIGYLKAMGYDMNSLSNLLEVMDTALFHRCLTQEINPRSLGGILRDLDIAGWNLHNAGNDAFYTLEAMLAICVKDAQTWDKEAVEEQKKIIEERVEAVKKLSEERTRDLHEG